jgi:hypothetical protein
MAWIYIELAPIFCNRYGTRKGGPFGILRVRRDFQNFLVPHIVILGKWDFVYARS